MNRPFSLIMPLAVGAFALCLLVVGLGLWSTQTKISGAVVATGTLGPEGQPHIIAHPEGGLIQRLFVMDGHVVRKGERLARLDDMQLQANRALLAIQLAETRSRIARLQAERLGAADISFPSDLLVAARLNSALQSQLTAQRTQFSAHQTTLKKETDLRRERHLEIEATIAGMQAERSSVLRQRTLIEDEITSQSDLREKGLVPTARLSALRREYARLTGEAARLRTAITQSQSRAVQLTKEHAYETAARHEEIATELRDLTASRTELRQRSKAASDALARLDIRSPIDGIVYDTRVATRDTVLRPADPILSILPADHIPTISTEISPADRDQIHLGQAARLWFTTKAAQQIEVRGTVTKISANTIATQKSQQAHYAVDIRPDLDELAGRMPAAQPGTQVTVLLRTTDRTPLSFLIAPMSRYFTNAFRG